MSSGAITLGDLAGKLEWLEVTCPRCEDRRGRYRVAGLIAQFGAAKAIPDWLEGLRSTCPKHQGGSVHDRCAAHCPQLAALAATGRRTRN